MIFDHCEAPAKFQDTCASSQIFHVASLHLLTGMLATSLLRAKTGTAERSRCQASSRVVGEKQSQTSMRGDCSTQWQHQSLLYSVAESPTFKGIKQLILPKSLRSKVLQLTATQYPNGWIPGSYQDPESCQGMILMGPVPTRCLRMVPQLWSLCTKMRTATNYRSMLQEQLERIHQVAHGHKSYQTEWNSNMTRC